MMGRWRYSYKGLELCDHHVPLGAEDGREAHLVVLAQFGKISEELLDKAKLLLQNTHNDKAGIVAKLFGVHGAVAWMRVREKAEGGEAGYVSVLMSLKYPRERTVS